MNLFNFDLSKEIEQPKDWKSVVHEGVKMLVEHKDATYGLEQAIIKITEELGPYYVLVPGLALLHAPLGEYAIKTNTSLLFLKHPVNFSEKEGKWAKIVFTLSASDTTSHMGFIKEFGDFFGNEKALEKVLNCKSLKELKEVYLKLKGGEKWK